MRSGFFNSEITGYDSNNMPVYDRAEEASFFAKYFSQFVGNGVYANPSTSMQVIALDEPDMYVRVSAGTCFINGYLGWVENSEVIEIEEVESQSRIDRIVARWSLADRKISIVVLKGEESGSPVAPEITRTSSIYDIALADISITSSSIEITDSMITDLRLDTELCGIVTGVIEQVDTTTLFNQYLTWFKETQAKADSDIEQIEKDYQESLDEALNEYKQTFDEWFANLKVVLSDDVATNLQNEIETNATAISELTSLVWEAISQITTEDGYSLVTENEEYIVGGI